ncbi:MAG: hypothetical protein HYX72_05505 [Acidobacteria bacterium]|nr:hypothetical protein [Acidobacteriota bacterium]
MSKIRRVVPLLLLLCCVSLMVSADVLMLKDGQTITGKYQGGDQSKVRMSVNGLVREYSVSEINSITFAPAPPEQSATTSAPARRPLAEVSAPLTPRPAADTPSRTAAPAPKKLGVTIHAGSVVTVRMIDPVDSATDEMGQTYRASLDEPLMVNGETVVPRGADVTVKLVSKEEAGRIKGRSELSLVLMDITVQGRRYEMTTSEVTQSGSSRGKQTATRAGIGAALGATIGAIAGGGKGAAIGAATGAGAGTAVQLATHGEQVKVPSESRLDFTLAQPLNL